MNTSKIVTAGAISVHKGWTVVGFANGVIAMDRTRASVNVPNPTKYFDGPVRSIAFSADGRQLAMGADSGLSYCLSTNGEGQWTGRQYKENLTPVSSIDVSDSGTVIVGHGDHRVMLWNSVSGKTISSIRRNVAPKSVGIAQREHIVVIGDEEGLDIRDTNSGTEYKYVNDSVTVARLSPDGRTLAVANTENVVTIYDSSNALDVTSLPVMKRLKIDGPVCNLALTNDSRVGICRSDGFVHVWSPDTDRLITPNLLEDTERRVRKVWAVDFDGNGNFLPLFTT